MTDWMPTLPEALRDIAEAQNLDRLRIIYAHTKRAYGDDEDWQQAIERRKAALTQGETA